MAKPCRIVWTVQDEKTLVLPKPQKDVPVSFDDISQLFTRFEMHRLKMPDGKTMDIAYVLAEADEEAYADNYAGFLLGLHQGRVQFQPAQSNDPQVYAGILKSVTGIVKNMVDAEHAVVLEKQKRIVIDHFNRSIRIWSTEKDTERYVFNELHEFWNHRNGAARLRVY